MKASLKSNLKKLKGSEPGAKNCVNNFSLLSSVYKSVTKVKRTKKATTLKPTRLRRHSTDVANQIEFNFKMASSTGSSPKVFRDKGNFEKKSCC